MNFIGVDIGGTVTKAGIYNELGQEIHVASQYAQVLSEQPGFTERNMHELWDTVCSVIKKALYESQVPPLSIGGIGFSSHGKGLYAIDKKGEPVRNGIISSDTRALAFVKKWYREGIDKLAYPKGLQQLWTGHPVSLLAWLKAHEPANYDRIDAVLMVHDYVRFRLTGEATAEITNISGSNFYNQFTSRYDRDMMALFGIEEVADKTAPVVNSTDCVGHITLQASLDCGLCPGTPVFGGFFDVVASAVSSGIDRADTLSAVAGTWSIATSVTDSIIASDFPYIWGKYCIPGKYFVHEGSPTSASNLSWFVKQFFPDDDRCYDHFESWIAQDTDSNLIFLPYLFGSNLAMDLPGALVGLAGHHTKKDIIAAIYRGIVFLTWCIRTALLNSIGIFKKFALPAGRASREAGRRCTPMRPIFRWKWWISNRPAVEPPRCAPRPAAAPTLTSAKRLPPRSPRWSATNPTAIGISSCVKAMPVT